MDVSMNVQIALGRARRKGSDLSREERVEIIRVLTGLDMVRHLRGFQPFGEMLKYRLSKHGKIRRRAPRKIITSVGFPRDESFAEILSRSEWKDNRRHDDILYVCKAGGIVLWKGDCTVDNGITVYRTLKIYDTDDAWLGDVLMTGSFFEDVIESLRKAQKRSLDAAESAIRQLRDNMRDVSDVQRRLNFYPKDHLHD